MSHPVPSHDKSNERVADYKFAPKKKSAKSTALKGKMKIKNPTDFFGGVFNSKGNKGRF